MQTWDQISWYACQVLQGLPMWSVTATSSGQVLASDLCYRVDNWYGRSFSASLRAKWNDRREIRSLGIMSTSITSEYNNTMQEFSCLTQTTSEQHQESTEARLKWDYTEIFQFTILRILDKLEVTCHMDDVLLCIPPREVFNSRVGVQVLRQFQDACITLNEKYVFSKHRMNFSETESTRIQKRPKQCNNL